MKKLLLAGVTLFSIAALAPASAQQKGSTDRPMSNSSSAQQNSNWPANNTAGQQTKNAAQPSRDEIKQAQEALDQKGFHVSADGVLGPQTKQALSKFQQQQKLQQTGELDQQTMSALGLSQSGSTTGQGNSGSNKMQQPASGSNAPSSSGMKK